MGDPRILALLESWGIAVNGTVVHNRKKSIKNKQVVRGGYGIVQFNRI